MIANEALYLPKTWTRVSFIITNTSNSIFRKNPWGISMRFTQCVFLVAQVEICQSRFCHIIICRTILTVAVFYRGYEGIRSLHFDPPNLHSCRTRSLLLLGANWNSLPIYSYIHSNYCTFTHLLAPWASKNNRLLSTMKFNSCSTLHLFRNALPMSI